MNVRLRLITLLAVSVSSLIKITNYLYKLSTIQVCLCYQAAIFHLRVVQILWQVLAI